MRRFHRDIIARVRGLGATDVRLSAGTRHPSLLFSYDGKEHRATLASTPGDANAVIVKMGDIRKMLNLSTNNKDHEEVVEVFDTPSPTVEKSDKVVGSVALYKGRSLRFKMPPQVYDELGSCAKFDVRELAHDHWELIPGNSYPVHRKGQVFLLECYQQGKRNSFGATPAEYVVVDGHALVRLLEPPHSLQTTPTAVIPEPEPLLPESIGVHGRLIFQSPKKPIPETPIPKVISDDLPTLLYALRHMEATTMWRVLRVDGKIVFQARIE